MTAHDWFDRWALRRAGAPTDLGRREVLRRGGIVGALVLASPLIQSVTAPAFAVSCGAGLTDCGGVCVDLQTDPANCGTCGSTCSSSNGGVCSGGTCNNCTPSTCGSLGRNCGTWSNGCGGTVTCGTCTPPQLCSGGGITGQCGGNCTPKTCAQLLADCGTQGNDCGATIECGTCSSGLTCIGTPSKCVNCSLNPSACSGCVPKTCTDLGKTCGTYSNGCGGTVSCGTCAANQACSGGHCAP